MKQCKRCGISKSLDLFAINKPSKDGHVNTCKACMNAAQNEKRSDPMVRMEVRAYDRKRYLRPEIASAAKARATARRRNPECALKIALTKKIYRAKPERRESNRLSSLKYKSANKHVSNAICARRRARIISATPMWANKDAILGFYETAQGLNMLIGEWHEVDHIVPLLSPIVCGLHCEANLRVITAIDNNKKGNRFWPDMPEPFQR